jgi:hypothetical protein
MCPIFEEMAAKVPRQEAAVSAVAGEGRSAYSQLHGSYGSYGSYTHPNNTNDGTNDGTDNINDIDSSHINTGNSYYAYPSQGPSVSPFEDADADTVDAHVLTQPQTQAQAQTQTQLLSQTQAQVQAQAQSQAQAQAQAQVQAVGLFATDCEPNDFGQLTVDAIVSDSHFKALEGLGDVIACGGTTCEVGREGRCEGV